MYLCLYTAKIILMLVDITETKSLPNLLSTARKATYA